MSALGTIAVFELVLGLGFVVAGCILFVVGNRLFGRKTGGKRLVVFVAGVVGMCLTSFIFQKSFSKDDAPLILVILGGGCFILSIGLVGASFASDERIDEAFEVVLRLF